MAGTKAFWDWFKEHNNAFLFINEVSEVEKEKLLHQLLEKLQEYCSALWFEIGEYENGTKELIITAEGDIQYFDKVTELVLEAPKIDNWTFLAFNPPIGVNYNVKFEDVELIPSEMWFLPLEHPENPSLIALRICTANFEEIRSSQWIEPAVFKVMDMVLGEKAFALDINYIEIDCLPENPEEEKMMLLSELPVFVQWHKTKYPRNLN